VTDSSKNKNSHLGDAIKDINSALEEWDKITNNDSLEQDVSRKPLEQHTKELLNRLQDQINDLSKE